MAQFISPRLGKATAAESLVDQAWSQQRELLVKLVTAFSSAVTPKLFMEFEQMLSSLLRELGRVLLEETVNGLEQVTMENEQVVYEGLGYSRLRKKTPNRYVSTLFGNVCLKRFGYRCWDATHVSEPCIFPLESRLGLMHGVTPALGMKVGEHAAKSPQEQTITWLREEHGVTIGTDRLRKFVSALSPLLSEHRQALQVKTLLEALSEANGSRGNRRPVLAVGRDGITMCENRHSFWEVATAATVTVFDRAGKRLHTVYLAHPPELGQATMSHMLNDLLVDLLEQWEGPQPTLAYVADSGDNESSYFDDVLRHMPDPHTGKTLSWQRVVDFYHAAERIWSIAEALFGKKNWRYHAWARRMLRILKEKPNGPKRVLHSAAAHAARKKLGKQRKEKLRLALNYIRRRTKWMQYAEFRQRHIPIGSGITEAACKTIFTQRLKLSGMRWSREGAERILALRVILLSGIWEQAYLGVLDHLEKALPTTYDGNHRLNAQTAA